MKNKKLIIGLVLIWITIFTSLFLWIKSNSFLWNIFNTSEGTAVEIFEQVKKWEVKEINKEFKINFPIFEEIVDSNIKKVDNNTHILKINWATKWDSLHEYLYEIKEVNREFKIKEVNN